MPTYKDRPELKTTFKTILDNADKENNKSIAFFYDRVHQKITIGGEKV